jgi:hypothetical protein
VAGTPANNREEKQPPAGLVLYRSATAKKTFIRPLALCNDIPIARPTKSGLTAITIR